MKTIDEYVIRGLVNENLELLVTRLTALHLDLNLLINGVPQSASITANTDIDKLKKEIVKYTSYNDINAISSEITSDFKVKIKYSYDSHGQQIITSDIFSLKEAEDCGIEIIYI